MITALENLHFVRPYCLLLLALIPPVLWLSRRLSRHLGHWQQRIDPELLAFLSPGQNGAPQTHSGLLAALICLLLIVAMAGPSWERLPQPIAKSAAATVYILDLSPSMLAEDVKPSRLVRAQQKLTDALKLDKEGLKALVVYAGEAHLVTPLTDDARTLQALVPSLSPRIMPLTGSNLEMALELAGKTLADSHSNNGQMVLLTDGTTEDSLAQAKSTLRHYGYPLYIIGLGDETGAPIPLGPQGFAKSADGEVVIAKNERRLLVELAEASGGYYHDLALSNEDLDFLTLKNTRLDSDQQTLARNRDSWVERGHWLVWLALPLVLFAMRSQALVLSLLVASLTLLPSPGAQADEDTRPFESIWQSLWLNPNQRGKAILEEDPAQAAQLFEDPRWRAQAQYQAKNYLHAQKTLEQLPNKSAEDWYNLGNAQAQAGELDSAIASYEKALAERPDMSEAQYNLELVKKLKQQQNQNQNQSEKDQKQDQQQDQNQQNQSQNQSQNANQSNSDNQGSDNKNQPQADGQSGQQKQSQGQQQKPQEQQSQEQQQSQADKGELDARRGNENQPAPTKGAGEPQATSRADSEEQADSSKAQQADSDEQAENPEAEQAVVQDAFEHLTDEQKQAAEQWLKRIEDDPANLLKRKFEYQYRQRKKAIRNGEWTPPENNANERW